MNLVWSNLFESFDPSIYYMYNFQFNWLFMVLPAIAMYNTYWLIPSRLGYIINLVLSLMYEEFKLSIGKNSLNSNIIIFMGTMFYLMFLNIFSLFPYIFPSTSHFMLNLSVSLTLWLGMAIYCQSSVMCKSLFTYQTFVMLQTSEMMLDGIYVKNNGFYYELHIAQYNLCP